MDEIKYHQDFLKLVGRLCIYAGNIYTESTQEKHSLNIASKILDFLPDYVKHICDSSGATESVRRYYFKDLERKLIKKVEGILNE